MDVKADCSFTIKSHVDVIHLRHRLFKYRIWFDAGTLADVNVICNRISVCCHEICCRVYVLDAALYLEEHVLTVCVCVCVRWY